VKNKQVVCPIAKVANILSDTWTILILHFLIEKPNRFCDLQRELSGISSRTLTLKLKKLTKEDLIEKTVKGIYKATKRGKGIRIIENAMKRYEKKFF